MVLVVDTGVPHSTAPFIIANMMYLLNTLINKLLYFYSYTFK